MKDLVTRGLKVTMERNKRAIKFYILSIIMFIVSLVLAYVFYDWQMLLIVFVLGYAIGLKDKAENIFNDINQENNEKANEAAEKLNSALSAFVTKARSGSNNNDVRGTKPSSEEKKSDL
jgi:uncharacterized membrane protein|tara:strand:+ start:618 stop:974 length:357 start_codon:yes stop_codon:yes gene_type:complete